MDQQDIIAGFEARAAAVRITIAALCARANIHPTTFSRWKRSARNTEPVGMTLTSIAAIERALSELEAKGAVPPAGPEMATVQEPAQ